MAALAASAWSPEWAAVRRRYNRLADLRAKAAAAAARTAGSGPPMAITDMAVGTLLAAPLPWDPPGDHEAEAVPPGEARRL